MKYYLFLLVLLSAICLHAQPQKNLLVEEFTSAGCGYCVLGIENAEKLHVKHGDRFITVAIHPFDDMMLIPTEVREKADEFSSDYGLQGIPTGLLNRKEFGIRQNAPYTVHPNYWDSLATLLLDETAIVDVSIDWKIEGDILTADIAADMFEDCDSQLAFGMYLVEDSVSGIGSGWDQSNYLSGKDNYQHSRFYYLPSKIKHFPHDNVLRAMPGGPYGVAGDFPPKAQKDEIYQHQFTIDLSKLTIQNRENLWVVGFVVQKEGKREILNSVCSGRDPGKPTIFAVPEHETPLATGLRNQSNTQTIKLSNPWEYDLTADIIIQHENSFLHKDWKWNISDTTIEIPANGSASFDITTDINHQAGGSQYNINIKTRNAAEYYAIPYIFDAYLISDGVDYIICKTYNADMKHFMESYEKIDGFNENYAFFPPSLSACENLDLNDYKLVIWPTSINSTASFGSRSYFFVEKMTEYVKNGHPLLLTSYNDLTTYHSKSDMEELFEQTFGIETAGLDFMEQLSLFSGPNNITETLYVNGIPGRELTQDIHLRLNDTDVDSSLNSISFDLIEIADDQKAELLLKFDREGLPDSKSGVAAKIDYDSIRAIFQGFGFEIICDEPMRRTLMANYLNWLLKLSDVEPDNINPAGISVAPNPAISSAEIRLPETNTFDDIHIRLVDINGATVKEIHSGTPRENIPFDCGDLPAGAYYIMATTANTYSLCPLRIIR